MSTVSIGTETLCSHVVSVMSISKKTDNSKGQTQNTVKMIHFVNKESL